MRRLRPLLPQQADRRDTDETVYTDVGCQLLDGQTCRCTDYAPPEKVRDCVRLTWRNVKRLTWLPPTCGYRLVAAGKDLPGGTRWSPADPNGAHAGISVRGKVAANEKDVPDERLVDFIVSGRGNGRRGRRRKRRREGL